VTAAAHRLFYLEGQQIREEEPMAPGMNAPMMRTKIGLEVAAAVFSRRMFSMGNVLSLSMPSGSDEPQFSRLALDSTEI
jgi:hypothetical protein